LNKSLITRKIAKTPFVLKANNKVDFDIFKTHAHQKRSDKF